MDEAQRAVADFTSKKGHTTEVDELVHPGVTAETIKPHRHEETTEAINREVHQHHHHTTVQPISHTETLPEKHSHNLLPIRKSEFTHGDPHEHEQRLAAQQAQFKDSSVTHETHHTSSTAPQVIGEHVHHHVHEIVQPIIHKETIQPEVVHTTHPIHEIHHHHATHHGMSALPMKTLDEFKSAGGILTGSRSSTHETYDGEPRSYNKDLETNLEKLGLAGRDEGTSTTPAHGGTAHQYTDSGLSGMGSTTGTATRTGETAATAGRPSQDTSSSYRPTSTGGNVLTHQQAPNAPASQQLGSHDSTYYGSPTSTSGVAGGGGGGGATAGTAVTGTDVSRSSSQSASERGGRTSTDSGRKKPSLLSRINPLKDSDGDGKRGFMS